MSIGELFAQVAVLAGFGLVLWMLGRGDWPPRRGGGLVMLAGVAALVSLVPGDVAASIGLPGTGKTRTVQEAAQHWPRVVVFDPYAARDRLEFEAGRSYRRPWPGDLVSIRDVLHVPELLDNDRVRLVVHPEDERPSRMGRDFSALARAAWRTGDLVLVAEECGLYSRDATDWLNQIASGGAHAALRLVLVCQSFGRIQKDGRRNVSTIVAGAQGEDEDLATLRKRCGRDFAARVATLRTVEKDARGRVIRPPDPPAAWRAGRGVLG